VSVAAADLNSDGLLDVAVANLWSYNVSVLLNVGQSVPLALACPAATAQAGVPYSSALTAAGGIPPYTFSVASGSLPPGLTLNTSSGAVTGTPSAAGAFSFKGQVVDSSGSAARTVTSNCTITVSPPPVSQRLAALLTEVTGVGPGKSLANQGGASPVARRRQLRIR
jgi:large repetitive protein